MSVSTKRVALVACGLTALTVLSAAAQPPSRAQIREQLRPVYEALQTDATYLSLDASLAGHLDDRATVDRYLEYLPMSPLELFKIDMHVKRYEVATPRILRDWHVRWIELHRQAATDLYGADYVEAQLRGAPSSAPDADRGPQPAVPSVGTNRNAASTFSPAPEAYQGEIQLGVNPNDPSQMVAAANTWDDIGGSCGDFGLQAAFYSSDGGVTWGYSCPPDDTAYGLNCSAFGGGTFGSDPAVFWDDQGNVFLEYMMLCFTSPNTYRYAIVVSKSTNGGATWGAQGIVINSWNTGALEDKEFYAIDNNPGSPFYGRHYTCWDRGNNEKFAYSTNGGSTWSEVDLPNVAIDLGCDMAVQDDGTVHLVWDTLNCTFNCTNERMFYTRSTNGGVSWSSPVLVRDFNLVGFSNNNCPDAQDDRCIGPFGSIDVDNSGGACDGNLYATFTDYTSGGVNNSDVWISRSTNNGASWSAPILVNDDGISGRVQFHPFLTVDQSNGHVVVGWHDARNDAGNDAIDYFVARSTDCGLSFEANIQASQPSGEFNNAGISFSNVNSIDNPAYNPNQYGEYMGVEAMGGKAYLAWSDTRHYYPASGPGSSQDENVGFAVVDFGTGPVCGNGVLETGEQCDGADLGGATCSSQGCSGGTPTCTGSCTLDYSSCTGCPTCDFDGLCEAGEDCNSCANDCISGSGASCGNGVCETADGENCLTCAADCNGQQSGKPSNRFCCGNGGTNPVDCSDARCTQGSFQCTSAPAEASCCGDLTCEGIEDGFNCALDCGDPPFCGDATCDPGEDACSCAVDCGSPPASEVGFCSDSQDNDCDTLVDCADGDCTGDPACTVTCLPKNASCSVDEDCCSLDCKPNGRCR